eukprot:9444008-Pyramimonas_sp.AAC.1
MFSSQVLEGASAAFGYLGRAPVKPFVSSPALSLISWRRGVARALRKLHCPQDIKPLDHDTRN